MTMKALREQSGSIKAREVDPSTSEPRTAPVRHYSATQRMHEAEERVIELEQALAIAASSSPIRELPLDELHEVPGRRRRLTADEYEELKASMQVSGVLEPIRVRTAPAGGWEIVSGHNKTAIARELGWSQIICRISEMADVGSSRVDLQACKLEYSIVSPK